MARAIRLSYAQVMLNAVFGASTGGMFLIGFLIRLGADDVLLGLVAAVPQFFVLSQFFAAYLVEREVSRKRITVVFSVVMPLCWLLIAGVPLLEGRLDRVARFALVIGVIALATLAGQFAGNARGSWVGELVPAARRGRFFGACGMFAGIVGAVFAVIEGSFLDFARSHGLLAFTALFFFGSVFGLGSAALNLPQPDCPLPAAESRPPFLALVRATFRNRTLMSLMVVHAFVAMGGIAGPFNPAYCLRDVGLSFFGLGLLNAVATASALASSPFWGRMVDRLGCRPILILGLAILAPCSAVWLGIPPGAVTRAYWLLPFSNAIAGAASAAVGVAISALLYKASNPVGRSVQFAVYGSLITAVGAPMPLVGGWLVSRLQGAGVAVDLRLTFALWSVFMALAALMAVRLRERRSVHTRVLLFNYIPYRLATLLGIALPTFLGPPLGLDAPRRRPVGGKPPEPGQTGKNSWQGPSDGTRMDVRE